MSRPKNKKPMWRANVTLPKELRDSLLETLIRRNALSPKKKKPAITLSGWIREKAEETIKQYR